MVAACVRCSSDLLHGHQCAVKTRSTQSAGHPKWHPWFAHARAGIDPAMAAAAIDENTIGVVGILGSTYNGEFDDIEALDKAVGA